MAQELAWNQFRIILQRLAAPAEEQLAAFPSFVVKADELVLEFDDWFRLIDSAGRDQVSGTEWSSLVAIDAFTAAMSGSGKELFTDHAVRADPRWNELRSLAASALQVFGWSPSERIGPVDELSVRRPTAENAGAIPWNQHSAAAFAGTEVNDISRRITAVLISLDNHRQAAVLAQMSHNLTVAAREGYDDDSSNRLRRYNEIQHRLTAQVSALLKGRRDRYPTDALLDVILEIAGADPIGISLCESIWWAFSRAQEQDTRV